MISFKILPVPLVAYVLFSVTRIYISPWCCISIHLQVVLDLLVLADRYEFMILKAKLEELLSSNINISTVLQLMSYADMYSAENLHKRCAEFVDSHAKQILVSPSMLLVPRAHLKTLLMRDSFFAKEIDIFEAVMRSELVPH